MLKKSAVWLHRTLWAAIVTLLVAVAVYASLGRYYIGYVEKYQDQVVQEFIDYTGLPLSVDTLHGRWLRLSPVFTMEHVVLLSPDSGQPVLELAEVSVQIDPFRSLLNRTVSVKRLMVNGVQCTLQEAQPGQWQLKGFPANGGDSDLDTMVDLVLSVGLAEIKRTSLRLEFFRGDDARLDVQELSLRRRSDFRRIRLVAKIDRSEHPVVGIVEANGDPRDVENFSARAYLKLDAVDFSAQLPAMKALGIDLKEAVIDSRIWLDWHPGTEIIAQGSISTPYLDIAALSGEKLQPLHDLSLNFRVEKSHDGSWKAWVPAFETRWQGEQLLFRNMVLEARGNAAALALPELSVDQTVKQLLAMNLLAQPERELIETLSPQGQLRNIHVTLRGPPDANEDAGNLPPRFTLRANLNDISIEAWHGAPGSRGISGYLEAQPLSGVVDIDAQDMELSFPHVYHHSLQFNSVAGQVQWSLDENSVRVKSGPLIIDGDFGLASGLLTLDLPLHKGEGTPLMDLSIGLRDTDASYRDNFLPYVLDQHLLDWLADSIPEGHIVEGGFIYRGSLLHEDHLNRTVQLFFNVRDASLEFSPDWPPLHNIQGLVLIDDGAVRVEADSAGMNGMALKSMLVTVDPIDDGQWLQVDGKASGSASDALGIVNGSVIDRMVGGAFQDWKLDGKSTVAIDLGIPLGGSKREPDIDVSVQLADADLSIPEHRVEVKSIKGPIHYTSKAGLNANQLRATLYGKPLQASVTQQADGAVSVDLTGRAAMTDVARWSGQPAMTFVSGETDFKAQVYIAPHREQPTPADRGSEISVESDLQGVTIDLPQPFAKAADARAPFFLRQPLTAGGGPLTLGIRDQLELQLDIDSEGVDSGLLLLGKVDKKQRYPGLLVVTGQIDEVNFDAWESVINRYLGAQEKTTAGGSQSLALGFSNLRIDRFEGFSQTFSDNVVDMRQQSDGWWLSVVNPILDGELFIPFAEKAPVSVLLDRLALPKSDHAEGAEEVDPLQQFDLNKLTAADIYVAIADLSVGEQRYGTLNFEVRTEPGHLQLANLGGLVRSMRIGIKQPATLDWRLVDGEQQTHFTGDVDFSDLGAVLEQWNYERFIESEYGFGRFDLAWPGSPNQFNLARSDGSLAIQLKKGRFLKASNTASGTMKVVGIVNLMNIVRRLQLDFSDVFNKGISYDKVSGAATIADSQLHITDTLEVKSPSSRFNLRGSADLQNSRLDMELVATLPVASNLPWIAALAGGLPTAAGVYLASKIFEEQVDRFSSAVYSVTGDWNDPELKFKRVFDRTDKETPDQPDSGQKSGQKAQEKAAPGSANTNPSTKERKQL